MGVRWRALVGAVAVVVGALTGPGAASAEVDAQWNYQDYEIDGQYIALVGYFNKDSRADILWYGVGSIPDSIWFGGPLTGQFTKQSLSINGTFRPIVGDFALDSYTDIFWYCPGTCKDYLWTANGSPEVFQSNEKKVDGTFYVPFVNGAGSIVNSVGGYTLRDFGFGKDDIFWYAGSRGSDYYWRFNDNGDGGHVQKTISISSDYALIRGNFSGGNGYDDVLLYAPGTRADYLWTADGTGKFAQKSITVNGYYAPVTIERSPVEPPGTQVEVMDSVYWYDVRNCGRNSPLWHFNTNGTWSNRSGNVPAPSTCRADDAVINFPGTSSAIVHRGATRDYQVFDRSSSASVKQLTLGSRDVNGAAVIRSGDFNGDGKADILWYKPGTPDDSIWYGRVATAVRTADPGGVPAASQP